MPQVKLLVVSAMVSAGSVHNHANVLSSEQTDGVEGEAAARKTKQSKSAVSSVS